MKREKRQTKREKRTNDPGREARLKKESRHIHCIACGRHLEAAQFTSMPPTAVYLTCDHKSQFPACVDCQVTARYLIAEHDRTGNAVASASAWH